MARRRAREQPDALAAMLSVADRQEQRGGGAEAPPAPAGQPQEASLLRQACAIYNNVSHHLDVSAGLAWALQVRGGRGSSWWVLG